MTHTIKSFYTLILGSTIIILGSGCSSPADQKASDLVSPTHTQIPTETNTPTPTLTPTATPTPTPTPIGGGLGRILFRGYDFESETTHLYSFNSDGSEFQSVIEVEGFINQFVFDNCFRLSPNGGKFALVNEYQMDEGGNGVRLLITDVDFSDPPIVIDDDFQVIDSIDWSADNKYIAYFGHKIDRYTLTVANLSEDDPITESVIDPPFRSVGPDAIWSPDSNQFLFSLVWDGNWEIMIVDVEEKTIDPFIPHPAMDYRVLWSPDGKYISFASNRDQNFPHEQIFVMNEDGSNIKNIVNDPATDGRYHSWSPDSSRIAYLTSRDNPPSFLPDWSIYTVKPDGTGLARVSGDIFNPRGMRWSPDGKFILFQERKLVNSRFVYTHYITPSDGSTPPRMLPEWLTLDLEWSPDSLSPDGKQIVFHDKGNIYVTGIDATEKPEPLIEVDPNKNYYCFSWLP
jgi:Tol biopolymer transport system component